VRREEIERLKKDSDDERSIVNRATWSRLREMLLGQTATAAPKGLKKGVVIDADLLDSVDRHEWWKFAVADDKARLRSTADLFDVELPDGSGPELVDRMRAIPSLSRAKFVGMSSYEGGEIGKRFDAFLPKPFHPKRLASLLRKLLNQVIAA